MDSRVRGNDAGNKRASLAGSRSCPGIVSPPARGEAGQLQVEQLAQLGDADVRIGRVGPDPPADRGRIDEEYVARDERRVLVAADLPGGLPGADQVFDAADQPLAGGLEFGRLLAMRGEGQLLEQDARQAVLARELAVIYAEELRHLIDDAAPRHGGFRGALRDRAALPVHGP